MVKPEMQKPFGKYYPLIVILAVILAASIASYSRAETTWMATFMGLFFIIFAMFKLLDLAGFAKGFAMYDWLTKKYPPYAHLYPFIELALGLCYLSGLYPLLTNLITLLVMGVSAYGVIKALKSGADIRCACLGTVIDLPLSTVSVIENIGMGTMAFIGLIAILF